jgi:hypothetical protein
MNIKNISSVLWTVLCNLPMILALIGKIREAFDSQKVSEVLGTLQELITKIAPPAPTADSTGETPANLEAEKQKRWLRFRDRIKVAKTINDKETYDFCSTHYLNNSNPKDYDEA